MLTDIANAPLDDLLREASRVRSDTFGTEIDLCAIVNIKSGRCTMDCRFCAQSQHHQTSLETYPLLHADKLLQETHKLWNQNISRVGWVSSGYSPAMQEIDSIATVATSIVADEGANQLCASLGQLDLPALQQLKDAGFCRYHHNLETSERFYPAICTTQRWRDRRATVERVKALNWSVCGGGLFGLGETWEDRFQLALTLKDLEVDSVPINFFSPISGTPLADQEPLSVEEALRIVVLFRLTLPRATIRICGGRPTVFRPEPDQAFGYSHAAVSGFSHRLRCTQHQQDELLFHAGANALMTGNYLTTSGISPENDRQMIELFQRDHLP